MSLLCGIPVPSSRRPRVWSRSPAHNWAPNRVYYTACCRKGCDSKPDPASYPGTTPRPSAGVGSLLGYRLEPSPGGRRGASSRFDPAIGKADGTMPRLIVLGLLRFYKAAISPWLPSACRFRPTCSEYMMDAVSRYGVLRGVWLGCKRLGRCHPFHTGGYDPVR